jgi:anti-sigma B factor antagonist
MERIQIDSKFADKQGEIMVVQLGGHIDQSNSYQLQKMFDNIIHSGCFKVIVDFGKLYYMSSAGWGVFIGEIKRFRDNGGDIKLANMNSDIYDVFQMLEFYHILQDYNSIREAAISFNLKQEELNLVNDDSELTVDSEIPEAEKIIEEIDFDEQASNDKLDVPDESDKKIRRTEIIDFVPGSLQGTGIKENTIDNFAPLNIEDNVKLTELPIYEKVKRIVAQNPLIGAWGIRKILKHEHFGYTEISFLKLRSLLKELGLDTKKKRYRYFRSC